jgi:Domain of unknown function (DUF4272)
MSLLEKRGLTVPVHFPLLEEIERTRNKDDILARLLCLHAAVVCAFGFAKKRAIFWLRGENLTPKLTANERSFIFEDVGTASSFQIQIEGMWALTWVLGLVEQLDFWSYCSESFASLMPDVIVNESSARISAASNLRSVDEIVAALDLAYCLHWNVRQAQFDRRQIQTLESYAIIERRRALEWVVGDEEWDSISLDT